MSVTCLVKRTALLILKPSKPAWYSPVKAPESRKLLRLKHITRSRSIISNHGWFGFYNCLSTTRKTTHYLERKSTSNSTWFISLVDCKWRGIDIPLWNWQLPELLCQLSCFNTYIALSVYPQSSLVGQTQTDREALFLSLRLKLWKCACDHCHLQFPYPQSIPNWRAAFADLVLIWFFSPRSGDCSSIIVFSFFCITTSAWSGMSYFFCRSLGSFPVFSSFTSYTVPDNH